MCVCVLVSVYLSVYVNSNLIMSFIPGKIQHTRSTEIYNQAVYLLPFSHITTMMLFSQTHSWQTIRNPVSKLFSSRRSGGLPFTEYHKIKTSKISVLSPINVSCWVNWTDRQKKYPIDQGSKYCHVYMPVRMLQNNWRLYHFLCDSKL